MDVQNVNEILDALGARFGATGAHLWDVLVRQAYVEAAYGALVALATVAWIVGSMLLLRHAIRTDWNDDVSVLVFVAAVIVGLVLMVATLGAGLPAVAGAFNPEYFALQKVLGAFR